MKKQSGFTLVESIIALTVTSILVFIIISFMTNSLVGYARANTRSDLLNEAQIALDVIGRDIRLSGNADTNNRWPDAYAPAAPDEFSWASDQDTLILATAAEDADRNIIFADPAEYISEKNNNIFFVEANKLFKRVLASPVTGNSAATTCPSSQATPTCPADKELLSNITSFAVTYLNEQNQEVIPTEARSIEISVVLQKDEYSQPVSVEYTTRMVFRND